MVLQHLDGRKRNHRAHHQHVAVSEVDDAQDAINHRIAECDDGIDAAKHQSVDDLLDESVHVSFSLYLREPSFLQRRSGANGFEARRNRDVMKKSGTGTRSCAAAGTTRLEAS